jgi:hypothetical protein
MHGFGRLPTSMQSLLFFVLAALLLGSCATAGDFEDRLAAAAAHAYKHDQVEREQGFLLAEKLAEENEERLLPLIQKLDLDTATLLEAHLRSRGFYFDKEKTLRSREILAEFGKPPPTQLASSFGRLAVLPQPTPERKKLVEEFLALGPQAVRQIAREASEELTVEILPIEERIYGVGEDATLVVKAKNVGDEPIWFLPQIIQMRDSIHPVHFNIALVAYMLTTWLAVGADANSEEDVALNTLALMQRVLPGETFEYARVKVSTKQAGLVVITLQAYAFDEHGVGKNKLRFPVQATFHREEFIFQPVSPPGIFTTKLFVMGASQVEPFEIVAETKKGYPTLTIGATKDLAPSEVENPRCFWIAEGQDGKIVGKGIFGEETLAKVEWRRGEAAQVVLLEGPPAEGVTRLWLGFQRAGDSRGRVARAIEAKEK